MMESSDTFFTLNDTPGTTRIKQAEYKGVSPTPNAVDSFHHMKQHMQGK